MGFDQREFRNALGTFATGVTIVTANPKSGAPIGMTVNSFASLSLDPPLVLWNLQNSSDCFEVFVNAEHFAINVLAQEQAEWSNRYARKNHHQLDESHFQLGRVSNAPLLEGVRASFECRAEACHAGGDHKVLVGRVLDYKAFPDRKPLLFCDGAYGALNELEGG